MPITKLRPSFTFDQDRLEQLRALAPEAFADGKINWDVLKEALGENLEDESPNAEHFGLFWPGKREARRFASKPSSGTLIPAPGEGVDENTTHNIFIEGDNLEVLKLLQKSYAHRVRLLYIDPPYNTGRDFIYSDNFSESVSEYLKKSQQADNDSLLTSNPKSSGRFHSAWLDMMYPRLRLARSLLTADGAIFVSIDDNEVHNLRALMNEVFGEENFIATIIWHKIFSPKNTARHFSEDHDYIVVYAQNAEIWQPDLLPRSDEANARYSNLDNDPRGVWMSSDLSARNFYGAGQYTVTSPQGRKFDPPVGRYWIVDHKKFLEMDRDKRIWWGADGKNRPRQKRFLSEVKQGIVPQTIWSHSEVGHTQEAKQELLEFVKFENTENVLDTVKPTRLIQRILQIATRPSENEIILDFFSGSAPTAHAVMKQNVADDGNRKFIMIQIAEPLPNPEPTLRTISDIGKKRIESVSAKLKTDGAGSDLGFRVFKLAPSNFQQWRDYDGQDLDALETQFAQFETPLVEGWTRENLLTEILLQQGFPLDSALTPQKEFTKNEIVAVASPASAHKLFVCLDEKIHAATIQQLKLAKRDVFICLDSALSSEAKVRLGDATNLVVI